MTPLPDMAAVAVVARQSVEYQEVHLYQDYTHNLGGYTIALIFLSAAAMVMRVWCRLHMREALGRDDWTFLVGSALSIGSFIVIAIYAFDAGLGKHWVALTPEQKILFPKLNYAYNILNVIAYPLVKISILLLYLRLFFVIKTFCRIVWIALYILVASLVANTMVSIFSCHPVRGFYDASVPATCIDSVAFYYWTAVWNCVTDLFILIAPMPVIWRRNLSHKVAISSLFILGGLTFVVSVLRIVYYLEYSMDDPSYSFLDSGYATPGEVCLAVIVAGAPTWYPVWNFSSRCLSSMLHSYHSRGSQGQESLASVEPSRAHSNIQMVKSNSRATEHRFADSTTDAEKSDSITVVGDSERDASKSRRSV